MGSQPKSAGPQGPCLPEQWYIFLVQNNNNNDKTAFSHLSSCLTHTRQPCGVVEPRRPPCFAQEGADLAPAPKCRTKKGLAWEALSLSSTAPPLPSLPAPQAPPGVLWAAIPPGGTCVLLPLCRHD